MAECRAIGVHLEMDGVGVQKHPDIRRRFQFRPIALAVIRRDALALHRPRNDFRNAWDASDRKPESLTNKTSILTKIGIARFPN